MAMITIRVSDDEKEWLDYMAEFHGVTLSDLVKKYSMDQLEDEYDTQVADRAYKRWVEDNKTTIPMSEILDEFGAI